jgi:predicted RNA-binding protein YlxR (DUF448 family)
MCVVTRERYPKNELFRLVDTEEGAVLDVTGKLSGRGVNFTKSLEIFEQGVEKGSFERALKRKLGESEIESIKKDINKSLKRDALRDESGRVSIRVKGGKVKLS